jgi:phage terminase large subunit-like protein
LGSPKSISTPWDLYSLRPKTRSGDLDKAGPIWPSFSGLLPTRGLNFSPLSDDPPILRNPIWNPRPAQRTPAGDWTIWGYIGGRGIGKTRVGAEWTKEQARSFRFVNIIAPTADDARDAMVEGESGILACCPSDFYPEYQPSKRRLEWPNGSKTLIFSADEPERLRGKQHEKLWMDEVASWRRPEAYDQAMFGLRLGRKPQALATTTPKPGRILRRLLDEFKAQGESPGRVAITGEATYANRANLAPEFFSEIIKQYEGTRLGRQEIMGEYLDDTPGALWTRAMIHQHMVPDLARVVVAIDPAVTESEDSDETGIVAAGLGVDGKGYLLADRSCRLSPDGWAKRALAAYDEFSGDLIVAEVNNGGDLVGHVIHTVQANAPYKKVHASRGKAIRAGPVAALYEQGRIFHAGEFAELEDQLCSWTPESGQSPDRLDALVWAFTELMVEPEPDRRLQEYEGI